MSTFVSIGTGTQSFVRLLDKVAELTASLPQPVIVQHGNTPFASSLSQNFKFVDQTQFDALLGECELFITHGGSGSVFAALRSGKKPVVMPRLEAFDEVVDDHQVAFVEELTRKGLIHPARNAEALPAAIEAARIEPRLRTKFESNAVAIATIKAAIDDRAPADGKVLLVCPSGGHLAEMRSLAPCYAARPHFYVMNVQIVETPDMVGRTQIITLSQRDWKFLVNIYEALHIIRRERPSVILTTGGGFSVAFTLVGKLLGIPTIYVETVAKVVVPTATGRIMYHLADRFFYQWPYLKRFFPNGEYVGLISLN